MAKRSPDVDRVLSIKQPEQRTPEWYETRNGLLTASDVAAALGINPYQSKRSLLIRKCTVDTPSKSSQNNPFTAHGNYYEDHARNTFSKMYNIETFEVGLFVHPVYKWLGGSPDGIAADGNLIEIKCPLRRKISHEIPNYYYPQVQVCMEILNIEGCYFIQYKPQTITCHETIDVMLIKRNPSWFAENLESMRAFWDEVLDIRAFPEKANFRKKVDPSRVIDLRPIDIPEPEVQFDSEDECMIQSDSDEECTGT